MLKNIKQICLFLTKVFHNFATQLIQYVFPHVVIKIKIDGRESSNKIP